MPLNAMAHVHFISGNLRRSLEVLQQSLSIIAEYNTKQQENTVRRNLVSIHINLGEFSKALNVLDRLESDISESWERVKHDRLRASIQLRQLAFDKARRTLLATYESFKQEDAARELSVCLEYLGLLEYYRGRYGKARKYYQQVLDMPEPTASAVAQTLRMLTDVYVAEKKWQKATATAKDAEAAILKINERIELAALWRAYGQIHTHYGEPERSRDYFRKSIDLLREIGAKYELALSHFAAGE